VEAPKYNTQNLLEKTINVFVSEVDPSRVVLVDWDAGAVCSWSKCL